VFIDYGRWQWSGLPRFILVALALLTLLVGLSVQQPNTVSAAGPITVSPTSGPPGQTVTVSGSGFVDAEIVTLTFGSNISRNITVSGTTWTESIIVPSTPGGNVAVSATATSGTSNTSFMVTPTAALSRNDGSVGANITVTGEGFPASQSVTITFGGQNVRSVNSGSNGSINASFTVPSVAAGNHSVNIGSFPSISFRVSSSFTLSPGSGPPGTPVQILGTGFGPGASVNLTIGGVSWQSLVADEDGKLTGTLQIPQLSGGSKSITVSGGGGSATFNVTSTVTVAQLTAAPGDTVEVSGSAFGANESGISIKFAGATVASGITADSQGNWTSSFTVPSTTAGAKNITASGPSSSTASPVSITIGAGMTLALSSGPPGTLLKIRGSGARSNESLNIDLGGGLATFQATADGKGVWETDVTIPAAPKGSLTIRASGSSGEGATATFNVTPTILVSDPTGSPGSSIIVTGEGFGANQSGITVAFDQEIITSVSSDTRGSWTLDLTIPPAKKGTYSIKASGGGTEQQIPFSVAPGLFINKPQAGPGETVTVSGGGFAPNETGIVLKLGDTTIASGIAANADGSWDRTFEIPPLPANSYNLTASGAQTSAGSVQGRILTLTTRLTLSVGSGSPGNTVALTGQGFGANEQGLSILYDNAPVVSGITTDGSGNFSRSFVIPPSTTGRHSIVVGGGSTGVASGSETSFQVQPGFLLESASGPSGVTMNLVGTGFGPNEPDIEIKFGSEIVISGVSADENGSFEQSFLVPPTPAGPQKISSSSPSGSSSAQAQQTYTVVPYIAMNEAAGSVGMDVSVIGTGFTPDTDVALTYDDLPVATVTSDGSGSFRLVFPVPASTRGDHLLKALDERGKLSQETFEVESDPPVAPLLRSPEDGGRGGILGGFKPETRWTPVEDASGVVYNLQIASDPEFSDILLNKTGLPGPTYKLEGDEALARGKYYWRVQAVDRASNAGPYSSVHELNSGIIPIWLFSAMVALGLIASTGGAYAYYTRVYLPRKMTQQAPIFPELVRITRPQISAPAPPPAAASSAPALSAPRRALPSPFRRGGGSPGRSSVSPEQQARLRLVVDFVRSIPLMEVSPDLLWVEELVDSLGGVAPEVYEQVLRGDLEPVYQPAWMQHPTYQVMQAEAAAAPFLEGLEVYIESVNDCAADILAILRRIYGDLEAAGSLETLGRHQWRYVLTVAQSTTAWFRGTYLGQPSPREYIIKSATGTGDGSLAALLGVDRSPFHGTIIEVLHEEDLVFYRDLHIQLRNTYRNDDASREIAAKLTATSAMRDQLNHNITQMAEQSPGQ